MTENIRIRCHQVIGDEIKIKKGVSQKKKKKKKEKKTSRNQTLQQKSNERKKYLASNRYSLDPS